MRLKKHLSLVLCLMVGISCIAIIIGLNLETRAPEVRYTSLQGKLIDSTQFSNKVLLLNFWATSCPTCVAEMPGLIDTYHRYRAKGFEIVAIAMHYDPPNYVAAFAKQQRLPFIVALDVDGHIAKRFGNINVTPTTFIIDKQGRIVQRYLGHLNVKDLHALIEQLLT